MEELSIVDRLLIAAGSLAADGKSEFSAEDLVVRAHREFADAFSLKGYKQFPDSNRVLTKVMGEKAPMITRGWLEKTGAKLYRLTPKGVHDLTQLDATAQVSAIRIERSLEDDLGRLLGAGAFEMYRDGRGDDITFHQFCRFAGLSVRDRWQQLEGKLSSVVHTIDEAVRMGEAGQTLSLNFRRQNKPVPPDELRLLGSFWKFATEKFKSEMDEWKQNAIGA